MYTTHTATREFALKSAAATERAMERHACCKSQFKFACFSCGEMINRGDKITRCNRATTGMELRYRGADANCGLTMDETIFYQGATGKDMWVHIGCIPCYWDSLPPTSNEYSRPKLRPICTDWGVKVYGEFEEWTNADDSWGDVSLCAMGVPYFCMVKGYPKEKFMRDRIIRAVTRFQALWRGYTCKKAYPLVRLDAIATRIMNEAGLATLCGQEVPDLQQKKATEVINATFVPGVAEQMLHCFRQHTVGEHCEILFDKKNIHEAVYSGEIIKMQGGGGGLWIWVKFHADGEVRKYYWTKFLSLKKECKNFKRKMGIEAKIIGKIMTRRLYYLTIEN